MKTRRSLASAVALAMALAPALACSNPDKRAAEAALQTAAATVRTLSDVTMKFAPEERGALEQSFADAQALAARKDYRGARAAAEAIPAKAQQVLAAANARKEAVNHWSEVSFAVSQMVTALKARLEAVAQTNQLPAGVTRATVDKARAGAAEIEAALTAARAQAQTGDFFGALARANDLKARAIEAMKSVGMM